MYVFEIGETSYAFAYFEVPDGGVTMDVDGHEVEISGDGSEVFVFVDGQRAPATLRCGSRGLFSTRKTGKSSISSR